MRVLHTADWHLGRALEGRPRLDEQAAVLDELCDLADQEAVDLVLVAGDVYDSVNPPAAAEELFYATLERLSAGARGRPSASPRPRPVVVIAGNHDNPDRLGAAGPLASRHGIALVGLPGAAPGEPAPGPGAPPVFRSGPGWVEVAAPGCPHEAVVLTLPYPSEARLGRALREGLPLDDRELQPAYSDQVARLLGAAAGRLRPGAVRLVVAHLFAAGGLPSDSERPIQVGGAYTVSTGAFPAAAQYAALGHLHRPQAIPGPVPIRYCGSPLAYSFSEAGQTKGAVVVDLAPDRPAEVREVALTRGRPLVVWRAAGGLPQVRAWAEAGRDRGAWIDLELHVDRPLGPAELQLLRGLPAEFVHIRPVLPAAEGTPEPEARRGLPVDELFGMFYRRVRGGDPPATVARLFAALAAEEALPAAAADPAVAAEEAVRP